MRLSDARKLKPNDPVICPADRDTPAIIGTVTRFNKDLATQEAKKNIHRTLFIWVEVKGVGHKSLWPSNRLGGI